MMEVILLKDLDGIGTEGDVVDVKPGYARNFLVPRGIALRASKSNLGILKERIRIKKSRENKAEKVIQKLSEKLTKTSITIEVKAGEEEKLFGSVTAQDIQNSLEEQGITIKKSTISITEPIKSLGMYNVPIKLSAEIAVDIKVYVIKIEL